MLTRGYYTCGCGTCRIQSTGKAGSPHGRKARRTDANQIFRTRGRAQLNKYVANYDAEYAYDDEWEGAAYGAGYWD